MTEEQTRKILAILQADARREVGWKITFRHKIGNRLAIGYKTVFAETRDEAKKRADMWEPLIINIERL